MLNVDSISLLRAVSKEEKTRKTLEKRHSHLVLMSASKLASQIDVLKIITRASKPYKE